METKEFIIIARGGQIVEQRVERLALSPEHPGFEDFMEDEPGASFDEWCNEEIANSVDEFEQYGATCVVLSLEEYRNLPSF